jgi:Hypoxia induced protein conserved region
MDIIITVMPYLIGVSLLATLATLFAGLGVMSGGGSANDRYSNKLMRLRVAMQALTIALIIVYALLIQA